MPHGHANAVLLSMMHQLIAGTGQSSLIPRGDVEDLQNGASFIPSEVTDARRRGERVVFVQAGPRARWHWRFADGTTVQHD